MARTSFRLSYKPFRKSPGFASSLLKVSPWPQASYTGFATHRKFRGLLPTDGITTWPRTCSFTVQPWNMLVRRVFSTLILVDLLQAVGRTDSKSNGGLDRFCSAGIIGCVTATNFLN